MSPTTALAIAGIAGPVVFTILVIVQGVLQPDYSHVRLPVSALAAWPLGRIQETGFLVLGLSILALAYGMNTAVRPAKDAMHGAAGAALFALGGLGVIVAGAFSWRMVDGVPTEPAPHVVGSITAFLGIGLGFLRLGRRMASDTRWQDLAAYTRMSGLGVLLLFVGVGLLAVEPGTPLHPWVGALQRVVLVVWFSCQIVVGVRMRSTTPTTAMPRTTPS